MTSPKNTIRVADGRQDEIPQDLGQPCPVCVQSGHTCHECGNSFVLFDLRIKTPSGHAHLACVEGVKTRDWSRVLSADLLSLGEEPRTVFGRRLAADGRKLAERIAAFVRDPNAEFMRDVVAAQVTYYQRDIGSHRGHPAHIAGPRDRCCDFCLAPDIVTRFNLPPFREALDSEPGRLILYYTGDWTACATCAAAVKAADLPTLVRRGLNQPPGGMPERMRKKHYERLYGRVVKLVKENQ